LNDLELINNLPAIPNITEKQIAKIKKRIHEYKRAKTIFGHSTSQTSYTLQTLNMISDSPMSRMKQCMAQIDRKYEAVEHHYFNMEKKKIEIKKLMNKNTELAQIKIREIEAQLESIQTNMGNSLRQIGLFQDMFEAIRTAHNIPHDWNESDFEEQEYQNMVRKSFRLGIQDITFHNSVSKAGVEYFEQLGIHPQLAEHYIRNYLSHINSEIQKNKDVSVVEMYNFLDSMAIKFKDSFELVLTRLGLNEMGSKEFRNDSSEI
jgi:hypothetical protein